MKTVNNNMPVTRMFLALAIAGLLISPARAQTTAFTYQGRLNAVAGPANGTYDLRFAIYDANLAGNFIAGPITNSAVSVSNGLFTVTLDFGPGVFTGTNYWAEMGVRTNGGVNFSTLVPRQPLTPAPYALSLVSPQVNALCPAGSVIAYAGAVAPVGWLLCNGTNVSRTTYAALYAVVGTTYGVGDGSTTFSLPDLRGRVTAGKDDMGGTAAGRISISGAGNPGMDGTVLGAAGGSDRHTNTIGEMPIHSHGGFTATISGNSTTSSSYPNAISHRHQEYSDGNGGSSGIQVATTTSSGSRLTGNFTDTQNTDHKHAIPNDGGGLAHAIVQPTIILNYIIKY